jgi:hypothetical protein
MDQTKERGACIKFYVTSQPSCPGLALVTKAGFMVMNLRQKKVLPMEKLTETKKGETCEEQSQEHSQILTSNGSFTRNSSWQAKQSILHITVSFYGDCVNVCEVYSQNFGDKRTGCCIMTMHRLTLPFSPRKF